MMYKLLLVLIFLSVSLSMTPDQAISICTDTANGFERFKSFFSKTYSPSAEADAQTNFWNNCHDFLASQANVAKTFQSSIHAHFDRDFSVIENNRLQFIPGIGKSEKDVPTSSSQNEGVFSRAANKLVGNSCPPNHKSLSTTPKDQGSCGACWTFATTAAYESAWNRINSEVLDLSEQYILECTNAYNPSATPQSSCLGGILDYALEMLVNSGLPTEATYPYLAGNYGTAAGFPNSIGTCSNTNNFHQVVFPSNNSHALWFRYDNISSSAIQTLLERGSLVVAFAVESTFYSYSSGVYSCPLNASAAYAGINHAVELVGMDCNGNYIIKNSWGTTWGDGGYATIDAANDCGLAAFVYSILSESHLLVAIFAFFLLVMLM